MSTLNVTKYTLGIMSTYTKSKREGFCLGEMLSNKVILGSNGKVHLHNYIEWQSIPL